MRTQVLIVGGGPSGLMLSHILQRAGIDSIVLERSSRAHVLQRIRAGVLEDGTVRMLREHGLGERLEREGSVHNGTGIVWSGGEQFFIDVKKHTGRTMMAFGQTAITEELYAARSASRLPIRSDMGFVCSSSTVTLTAEAKPDVVRQRSLFVIRFLRSMSEICVSIRPASEADAASVITFFQKTYSETDFMLYEVGESVASEERQRQTIAAGLAQGNAAFFLAEAGGELVGICAGFRGFPRRQRHLLHLVLGVAREYWGRGIGQGLLQAIERWAMTSGVRRLELTVHRDNRRAVALYERLGFAHEGLKKGSLLIDGHEVDECIMAKRLAGQCSSLAAAT